MWRFKNCPKCGGDLFVDRDFDGWYEECLQCGYLHDLQTILQVKEENPGKPEKLAKAEKSQRKPELALAGSRRK